MTKKLIINEIKENINIICNLSSYFNYLSNIIDEYEVDNETLEKIHFFIIEIRKHLLNPILNQRSNELLCLVNNMINNQKSIIRENKILLLDFE